ncbi:MAG TPA: hypothetical protein PLF22_07230 [Pseudomonadales bacterium]|nr:hypothetical protein [Pseudomonadales bacterium]
MSSPSVIVVQRQTVDWSTLTPEVFRPLSVDFCRLWGKPEDYVFRLMQLWDATFAVSYLETRARLKSISTRNLSTLQGVEFIPYDGYRNIPDRHGFYLFMDDDDWAGPELGAVLDAQSPELHSALLWRAVNIGSPQQEYPVFVWGMNGRCMTNNYAVSSVWLDHLQKRDAVVQHAAAAKTLAALQDVTQLDVAITASNKSPCSSVSLDRGLQGDFSSAKLAALVDDYLVRMATLLPEHMWMAPWVAPLVAEVTGLFRDVSASRIQ